MHKGQITWDPSTIRQLYHLMTASWRHHETTSWFIANLCWFSFLYVTFDNDDNNDDDDDDDDDDDNNDDDGCF